MMQTAAKSNLILINSLSNAGFTNSQTVTSDDRSYLYIFLSELTQAFYSRQAFQQLADRLIRLAEHAYCLRDIKTVQEVSLILMNLPIDTARQVGQYYQALALKRNGKKDEAQAILGSVAEDAPLPYRARAIQTLGTIYHEQGHLDDALHLYLEAARATSYKKKTNLLANLIAHSQVSFIKSDLGDHQGALADLEKLLPIVLIVAKQSPLYFYAYQAELAFELAQVGRVAESESALSIALASPFAAAYPEWSETRNEIAAKRQSASPSVVAINCAPEPDQSPDIQPSCNVKSARALAFSWPGREKILPNSSAITVAVIAATALCQTIKCALELLGESIQARAPPALA